MRKKIIKISYSESFENRMIYETSYAGGVGYIPKDGGPGAPKEARQKDKILSTEGENFFENKFCYHSFRFAFLENCDLSKIKKVQATYVHTDLKIIGHFNSSNEKLNKLFDSAMRTKLNNVHGIFEDCARERLDYGGDIVALANSNLYTFDLNSFYKKIIGDFNSQQTKDGGFPETAPYMGIQTNGTGEKEGPLLWQLAVPYMLIKHYQFYGEIDLLKSNYKT
ncbi:hypothetical protein Q757_06675 [Oenococcus alcoholitolerans]|uniref:Alpha-L-rhamnosidase six-hairpin glycosidase domain-containing protein n=1 Tax=Oenococcus alcoholitolerans TaxID=931074 RepID=A0ABR4XQ08_9LACO|nr:hypothetical protein Q757_06675 [Oenococcus alcoholitolerans]